MKKLKIGPILALIICFVSVSKLYAAPYSFYVDSFTLTSNNILGVSSYFRDDFNNNGLTSTWIQYQPTVTESNGLLKLSNPGDIIFKSFQGVHAIIESTTVISTLAVCDGLGNSVATSTWLPILPQKNQIFFMEAFHALAPYITESISIGISRLSPEINRILAFPGTSDDSPVVFFGWENLDVGKAIFQAVPINSQDVTGEIVLKMMFNDDTNQFNGAFSLDGGNSFISPFSPVSPETFSPPLFWGMNAASCRPVPEPSTMFYFMTGIIFIFLLSLKWRHV